MEIARAEKLWPDDGFLGQGRNQLLYRPESGYNLANSPL